MGSPVAPTGAKGVGLQRTDSSSAHSPGPYQGADGGTVVPKNHRNLLETTGTEGWPCKGGRKAATKILPRFLRML